MVILNNSELEDFVLNFFCFALVYIFFLFLIFTIKVDFLLVISLIATISFIFFMLVYEKNKEFIRKGQISDPWIFNLLIYTLFFILSIIFTQIVLSYIFIAPIDANNARYLFSSLIQAQAAIISIIITMNFIAIQIYAQNYSNLMTQCFKKYPDIWILVSIYILSICFNIYALTTIIDTTNIWEKCNLSTQFFLNSFQCPFVITLISIILGIFSVLAIIPFFWNILTILRIENVIGQLSYQIPPEKKSIEDESIHSDFETIVSIFKVIYLSHKKGDHEVVTCAYNYLMALVGRIINFNPDFQVDLRMQKIQKYNEILKKSISKNQEGFSAYDIVYVEEFDKIIKRILSSNIDKNTAIALVSQYTSITMAEINKKNEINEV